MIPRSVRRLFDARSEPREAVGSQEATLELRGRKHEVRIVNLSASGAMVVFDAVPRIGEQVALHLADRGPAPAHVCWVRDGCIGVNFVAAGE